MERSTTVRGKKGSLWFGAVLAAWLIAAVIVPRPGAAAPAMSHCATGAPAATAPGAAPAVKAIPTQPAVGAEVNPPGDIPDNQAFVTYYSTAGAYTIEMPEGWARKETGPNVTFTDKLHQFSVDLSCAAATPTVTHATTIDVPMLAKTVPAFHLVKVSAVALPAGPGVLIQYQANSAPDAVTGKQIRLAVDRYEVVKNGVQAAISLAVPAGSDNVDVSNRVSRSFTWAS